MKKIFDSIKLALPDAKIYHDFAPNDAVSPFVVVQIVGGEGHIFIDRAVGGYNRRLQVTVWDADKAGSIENSRLIEGEIIKSINVTPNGAAMADYDVDVGLYGMRQHFTITH